MCTHATQREHSACEVRTINTVDTNTGSDKLFAIAILHRLCLDHVMSCRPVYGQCRIGRGTDATSDVTSVHNNDIAH